MSSTAFLKASWADCARRTALSMSLLLIPYPLKDFSNSLFRYSMPLPRSAMGVMALIPFMAAREM